jgi:RNA polymerase sigma-70 factor (ECF subfamily)
MTRDGTNETPDDATLLRRAHRDPAAFRGLYDRHVVRVHAFLLRRTGDSTAAFELTAETFSRAWLARDRFTDQGAGAAPWLFGIARNVLAGAVRERAIPRDGRRRVGLEAAGSVAAPREAWLAGLDEDLAAALSTLPETQRRAVELRVLDGTGYDDIGRELDISAGAARVRVHRGIAALRRLLRPDPPAAVVAPAAAPPASPTAQPKPGDHR